MDAPPPRGSRDLRDLTLDLGACGTGPEPVAAALRACPGVVSAHVDRYVTWALATFDPEVSSAAAILEHLTRAGLAVRVARLFDPVDADDSSDAG